MSNDKMLITQKITSNKSNVEFDEIKTKQIQNKDGEVTLSRTKVPYFPLRDKLVVKAIFEESQLVVRSEEKIRQSNPKSSTIVGIGPDAVGLNFGDEVHVSFNATIEPITFKGNDKSIKKMQDLLSDKTLKITPLEQSSRKVIMIEYYAVPYFVINGIKTEEV